MTLLRARGAQAHSKVRSLLRRTRTHRRTRMRLRRRAVGILLAVTILVPGVAYAATNGPGNPFLAPWTVTDSAGIPVSAYGGLAYDTGGFLEDITLGPASFFMELFWGCYVLAVSALLWLWKWCQQLQILDMLTPLAWVVGSVLQATIVRMTLVALASSLAVIGALGIMHKGNVVRGMLEIFLALLIGAAAAQNVGQVILADVTRADGGIRQARDLGAQLGAEIATGGSNAASGQVGLDAMAEVDKTNQKLADALIRTPHQLLQYGAVVDTEDSGKCKDAYDKAMKTNGGGDKESTQAVVACDAKYEEAVKSPLPALIGMGIIVAGSLTALMPTGVLILGFLIGVIWALWESVSITWGLLAGILPGQARVNLAAHILYVLMALGIIVFSLAFNGVVSVVTAAVLDAGQDQVGVIPTFLLLAVIMLVVTGLLVSWLFQARKRARNAAKRMGKAVAPQTKAMTPSAPKITASTVLKPAAATFAASRMLKQQQPNRLGTGASPAGPGHEAAAQSRPGPLGAAGRVASGTKKAVIGGTTVALKGTIGAPVYLPRAVGAAKAAAADAKERTKASVKDKVDTARLRGMYAQEQAQEFTQEYTGNLKKGAAWVKRTTRGSTPAPVQEQLHPQSQPPAQPAPTSPSVAAATTTLPRSSRATGKTRASAAAAPTRRAPQVTPPAGSSPVTTRQGAKGATLNEQYAATRATSTPSPVRAGRR